MKHSPAPVSSDHERNTYNEVFYELGMRWHWDSETYEQLLARGDNAKARLGHYLATRQPHLLKAYDLPFLVDLIDDKVRARSRSRASSPADPRRHFDWSQTLGGELGA